MKMTRRPVFKQREAEERGAAGRMVQTMRGLADQWENPEPFEQRGDMVGLSF